MYVRFGSISISVEVITKALTYLIIFSFAHFHIVGSLRTNQVVSEVSIFKFRFKIGLAHPVCLYLKERFSSSLLFYVDERSV